MNDQPEVPISKEPAMIAELTHDLNATLDQLTRCKEFIARARKESNLVEWQGEFKVLVPYWFMRDDKGD